MAGTRLPSGEQPHVDHLEAEALAVTHWFDAGKDGEPYSAIVRFSGRRIGMGRKPHSRDSFVHEETIEVVPGSGPVSVTGWVYGLKPGTWTVSADLIRSQAGAGAHQALARLSERRAMPLPPAAWSWRRWRLAVAPSAPLKTRWAPLVRFARIPAVIPGSWTALVGLGVLVGFAVQAAIFGRQNVPVGQSLLVDFVALLTGLTGAKLWYVVQHPGRGWRESVSEGWAVDGFFVVASIMAIATLLAFALPIGLFFDASAPALFFGVAIGRLGCFFTGCCAGRCTTSRWGVWSSDRRIGTRRFPTQLLESGAALLIAAMSMILVGGGMAGLGGGVFVGSVAAYTLIRQMLLGLRAERHKSALGASLTSAAAVITLLADAVFLLKVA